MGVLPVETVAHFLIHVDQQVLDIISEAHNKLALDKLNLCNLAFTGKVVFLPVRNVIYFPAQLS